ncbi:hypothetical protein cypCar_00024915 [Cyprinus carpio]|nr:hypothetical protein cypCar_00024915 [Cyprinus carpio]
MKGMKKGRSEVKKVGPLKMAALNGLTLSRMPLPDEGKDDPENTSNDERVSTAFTLTTAYLEEIQSVRRHTNSSSDPKNTNLPVLVHCSAGVGRTGVVILSEIMIACLEHNEMLDVPTVLNLLRQQRMMMVQTLSQYTFIYKVLIQFLRNSRLI